jgi:hypothetical protein
MHLKKYILNKNMKLILLLYGLMLSEGTLAINEVDDKMAIIQAARDYI